MDDLTRMLNDCSMYDDPSTILEVPPSASLDEIHAAFRKKARQHHPDLGGDRQKFQELTAAYEELVRRKEAELSASVSPLPKPARQRPQPNPFASPERPPQTARPTTENRRTPAGSTNGASTVKHLLTGKLPLQDQTTYFVLVNALDIFLTYLHLRSGNVEANQIAKFFIDRWDVTGMVTFKMSIVAIVCVIAQVVALSSLKKASWLLNFGTLIITCVVIYSVWLLAK